MSVSGVNSISPTPTPVTTPVAAPTAQAPNGDYLVRNSKTSQTKDSDGDYQQLPKSPAATSSNGVQAALSNLKMGG
jgi:hypothetical protein